MLHFCRIENRVREKSETNSKWLMFAKHSWAFLIRLGSGEYRMRGTGLTGTAGGLWDLEAFVEKYSKK
jgi:hypothetical protein